MIDPVETPISFLVIDRQPQGPWLDWAGLASVEAHVPGRARQEKKKLLSSHQRMVLNRLWPISGCSYRLQKG